MEKESLMFVVITYDVQSNRTEVFRKILTRFLTHEQNSVFLGDLTESSWKKLRELCLNLGDAHFQAARLSASKLTSTPSLNLIPSMTFGN